MRFTISMRAKSLILFSVVVGGVLADFILVGVFKVVWIAIYGTTYLALAMTLETYVARSAQRKLAKPAMALFLVGAMAGHIGFATTHQLETYQMEIVSLEPVALRAHEFPELLYVVSEKVNGALSARPALVPVQVEVEREYSCLKSFIVESVAGVDVKNDSQADWTLRVNAPGSTAMQTLPSMTDNEWPWCKLQFYRSL